MAMSRRYLTQTSGSLPYLVSTDGDRIDIFDHPVLQSKTSFSDFIGSEFYFALSSEPQVPTQVFQEPPEPPQNPPNGNESALKGNKAPKSQAELPLRASW